jgi:hypothetical protein
LPGKKVIFGYQKPLFCLFALIIQINYQSKVAIPGEWVGFRSSNSEQLLE